MVPLGKANSVSTVCNWFINSWVALHIPTVLNNIPWVLYVIFAGIFGAPGVCTWLFQPETAGRSLEEMDGMSEPHRTMWIFRDGKLTRVRWKKGMVSTAKNTEWKDGDGGGEKDGEQRIELV